MGVRSFVAAVLVLALISAIPATARAQESLAPADAPVATPSLVTTVVPSLALRPLGATLDLLTAQPLPSRIALFAPTPDEIRMSRGTKAVIIIAIIAGSLLLIGAVVLLPKRAY